MAGLDTIVIHRPKVISRQIADSVRELILSGELKAGSKLPASQTLAARWGADVATVHRALTPLVKEGLLSRTPGAGTFVQKREAKLTRVAIYVLEDFSNACASRYAQSVTRQLQLLLHAQDRHPDVWVDPRSPEQRAAPWPELLRAAQQRRIQAVIAVQVNRAILPWLSKLPVPLSVLGPVPVAGAVTSDLRQLARLGVATLAEQGCRSLGIITPMLTAAVLPGGGPNEYAEIYESFTDACRECGVTTRREWMVAGSPTTVASPRERLGYEMFHALWRQREQPAGLLIFPDHIVEGAMAAALELQVRVPADLKLAVHKNAHIDLFAPLPATFIISDEAACAQALWTQVEKQFHGEPVSRSETGFTVESHQGWLRR